ncbi:serine hydrolase domain-containing protein [uncultured Chitinophaga sp.]|jgi:Beta-lactamase class C and other penicillin binding proteins|uniref:serine hydrolase domain-containing protein n=1 Tax=uncultured Chitinophaga sp. TaxID=339340 RepID=UPI002614AB91|nr:serine hydrolase domain-containing protein [uncultured Chitinophaga sp.]
MRPSANNISPIPSLLFVFSCLLLISPLSLFAQKDRIDTFIENSMSRERIAGFAVGIIKDGKVIKTKGYGYANLELNIPVTTSTVFKVGSISKHIIAVAILQFIQEGKLQLDDPATKFFPDAPPHWGKITIRHLLNHSSGLKRESPAFDPMAIQPDSFVIRAAYKDSLVFPTGSKWQYCNLGYFMLADIIRQISGKSFADYMKQEIFEKNGLMATRVTSLKDMVYGRANGYVNAGKDTVVNALNYVALRPSGAFLSNIDDMVKWEMLIQGGKILSRDNWDQMWTDTTTTGGIDNGVSFSYGYGWYVSTYKNRKVVYHGGVLPGFRAMYYRLPEERTTIIILTNSEPTDTRALGRELTDVVMDM